MNTSSSTHFDQHYQTHLQHLKLKGLQAKTIEAYSRAIRRVGDYFDRQIDDLSVAQLTDYFSGLVTSHSWSTVKRDLYGLKFYYAHVLCKPWVAPELIKAPKSHRLTTALRSFLRYARYCGNIALDLAAAVPVVANWSMTSIPRAITAGQVRQLLVSIDRHIAMGRRD